MPAVVIGALNAQRSASGIPAGIVENTEWSSHCATSKTVTVSG